MTRRTAILLSAAMLLTSCSRIGTPFQQPRTGLLVINPQFDEAYQFKEGLAAVRIGDDETGKWGYIDKQGKFVIQTQFDYAEDFADGLAHVQIGGKWGKSGYIDKQGRFVIPPQFDWAQDFSGGLAAVLVGDDETYLVPPLGLFLAGLVAGYLIRAVNHPGTLR